MADLEAATSFYERLGFAANPSFMRMRDFSAQGRFAHRLAIDEWQGRGAPAAPPNAAGLHHLTLSYSADEGLQRAVDRLVGEARPTQGVEGAAAVAIADPSGNPIELLGPAR